MDLYANILTSEYNTKLDGGLYILGGYDRRHGEYVVTFPLFILLLQAQLIDS